MPQQQPRKRQAKTATVPAAPPQPDIVEAPAVPAEDHRITAQQFAPTPSESVPMAGLLAHQPELALCRLLEHEWVELLDAYQTREVQ